MWAALVACPSLVRPRRNEIQEELGDTYGQTLKQNSNLGRSGRFTYMHLREFYIRAAFPQDYWYLVGNLTSKGSFIYPVFYIQIIYQRINSYHLQLAHTLAATSRRDVRLS